MTRFPDPFFSVQWQTTSKLRADDWAETVFYEEEGTLMLWAWPELLGWKKDIEWLFSPVIGQTWPGDLWGVDESGALILVETKRATSRLSEKYRLTAQ
jgi:hypothetical protein